MLPQLHLLRLRTFTSCTLLSSWVLTISSIVYILSQVSGSPSPIMGKANLSPSRFFLPITTVRKYAHSSSHIVNIQTADYFPLNKWVVWDTDNRELQAISPACATDVTITWGDIGRNTGRSMVTATTEVNGWPIRPTDAGHA